uniref:Uncharacterized protein n=1 Tax=Anopheles maculatus TaxID=74869 RepID=A0A182SX03_9DIPT
MLCRLKALFDYSSHIELSISQNASQLNHLHPAAACTVTQQHPSHTSHVVVHPAVTVTNEPTPQQDKQHFITVENGTGTVHHRHPHTSTTPTPTADGNVAVSITKDEPSIQLTDRVANVDLKKTR